MKRWAQYINRFCYYTIQYAIKCKVDIDKLCLSAVGLVFSESSSNYVFANICGFPLQIMTFSLSMSFCMALLDLFPMPLFSQLLTRSISIPLFINVIFHSSERWCNITVLKCMMLKPVVELNLESTKEVALKTTRTFTLQINESSGI